MALPGRPGSGGGYESPLHGQASLNHSRDPVPCGTEAAENPQNLGVSPGSGSPRHSVAGTAPVQYRSDSEFEEPPTGGTFGPARFPRVLAGSAGKVGKAGRQVQEPREGTQAAAGGCLEKSAANHAQRLFLPAARLCNMAAGRFRTPSWPRFGQSVRLADAV